MPGKAMKSVRQEEQVYLKEQIYIIVFQYIQFKFGRLN